MTVVREAIVLPAMFLTVTLLGGLRIGPSVVLIPPPLVSLVLGVMLIAALVRAGAFAPTAILRAERAPLENISGLIVLATLFFASTQVFTLVTPERGLLHAAFSVCFFVQLTTTMAGVRGRRNMLRSLAVLFGCAFVVRFIVLEGLYAADGGFAKRLLTAVLQGASLGTIQYEPVGTSTGYVAFIALALYLIGLVLLPAGGRRGQLTRHPTPMTALTPIWLLVMLMSSSACYTRATAPTQVAASSSTSARIRDDALRRARVWSPPVVPIREFDFASNPPHGFATSDEVSCRFVIHKLSGRTQKFHCQTADGRILKIKYGRQNAELQAEVAGSTWVASATTRFAGTSDGLRACATRSSAAQRRSAPDRHVQSRR